MNRICCSSSASLLRHNHTAFISAVAMSSSCTEEEKVRLVVKYHKETKHSLRGYARGPRGLDWANQPNPFRRFISAPLLPLLLHHDDDEDVSVPYSSLFDSFPPPKPISLSTVSQLFYHSLALSAWKTTGLSTWPLRVNPSSGNLHPTESYLISPPLDSLSDSSAFVAHYAPKEHSLEVRAHIPSSFFPSFFPEDSFLIAFSSVFWREAWKYGERSFRYCNHDVGHAISALSISAAALGWDCKLLDGFGYDDLNLLLGLPKGNGKVPEVELEHPDCLVLVFPNGNNTYINIDYHRISSAIREFTTLDWKGKPNVLSKEHLCWDIIYTTAHAVKKPPLFPNSSLLDISPFRSSNGLFSQTSYNQLSFSQVVRKRRSAVDMDAVTFIDKSLFYQILLHCLPSGSTREGGESQKHQLALPFRTLPWDTAEVHLALFVHRVSGLPKGLYFLVRNEDHLTDLKRSTRPEFEWTKPDGCPNDLPLYKLTEGDCQKLAKGLSCHQDIAGDGCFSLGMVARFEPVLREKGSWMYPRLFWETGVIGQVLYLEAHAMGISATGIGCYFDDPMHELLGFKDMSFQSLYHFTVGGPVSDNRIMTLPAYPGPTTDV
ncbi:unnamed protein product [Cochlearia groenlandica]